MRTYILERLHEHKKRTRRPFSIGLINLGGTITCIQNEKGRLQPVQEQGKVLEVLLQGAAFGMLVENRLLNINFLYHNPQDSSQMLDPDREQILPYIEQSYKNIDGYLVLHGTDTAAQTARFLHVTVPYYDPRVGINKSLIVNAAKPIVIASSQESAVTQYGSKLMPNSGSDGDVNLTTSLALLVDNIVGESGIMTNGNEILQGTCAHKGSESEIPAFEHDKGVLPIGKRTAFGISYNNGSFLERKESKRRVGIIYGSAEQERRILVVREDADLNLMRLYQRARERNLSEVCTHMHQLLPHVILYASKGDGNVQVEHYDVLKQAMEYGIPVCRVPIAGGRVSKEMHYEAPGGDIAGYNIEQTSARHKAQAILVLANEQRIQEPKAREQFFHHMMKTPFGNEFLPER